MYVTLKCYKTVEYTCDTNYCFRTKNICKIIRQNVAPTTCIDIPSVT